ncbi:MAG: hypothetical protein A3G34_02940 [Candidatus Lindowbacteria bacterium RIFCSPLOWO2_12_FULL_62_27]|nr:MAG: hypothetical protein A3G34_02940 [Candidatus Lindowbacteria bacterium RIFCSPLOWO2_12_FULL_62_27]OGH61681.1 MAG: hypothetical protein A3I06_01730 [Candidatus Lindowbacteria bacterium RIFCSPLOWO2_02_FULL_62_12]
MAEVLVVTSKIKKLIKEQGMRTSADVIEALSQMVEAKAKEAVERAKAAGKKTVQASDLA